MTSVQFIPQIQLLRGLSILLVFFYHFQLKLFPSGFLGVDIFFVLSGALMGLLYPRLNSKEKILNFYGRRANRVLPAYFAITILTVAATYFVVLPHEFREVTESASYALLLIPNIGAWMQSTYFAKNTFTPLLHLWSLGVELQFYLLYPALAYLLSRSRVFFLSISIIVLLACFVVTGISSKTSFFLTPFRIWEFSIGMFTAVLISKVDEHRKPMYSWIGLASFLLLIPASMAPLSEWQHPKYAALAVSVLSAVVILLGLPKSLQSSLVGKCLSTLGKYSYSLYLVHFPIIVLFTYVPFKGIDYAIYGIDKYITLTLITGVFAFVLYHLIEDPFRKRKTVRFRVVQYGLLLLTSAIMISWMPHAQLGQYTSKQQRIFAAWKDRGTYRCGKLRRFLEPLGDSCTLTKGNTNAAKFLLVGDSQADALKDVMSEVFNEVGASLHLMKQNCFYGGYSCGPTNLLKEIRRIQVDTVILHAFPGTMDPARILELVVMGEEHDFDVVVIDSVPIWNVHIPQALYEGSTGKLSAAGLSQDLDDYSESNKDFARALDEIKSSRFKRFSVDSYLCTPHCQYVDDDGQPYYFDASHLTITGARQLAPVFRQLLQR